MNLNGFPVERRRVVELIKADYNPRAISTEDAEALRRSIETFGLVEPIIVNAVTGNVVGGHQRLDALIALNYEETDVVVVSLPAENEKALNLALNKISGDWDYTRLSTLIEELQQHDLNMLIGFSAEEQEQILRGWFGPGTNDVEELWKDMPEFIQVDKSGRLIIVHFATPEAVQKFAELIGQDIGPKTKSLWFPKQEQDKVSKIGFSSES